MASTLGKKVVLALPLLLASLVPMPSTCQDYGDDNATETFLDTPSPAAKVSAPLEINPLEDETPGTNMPPEKEVHLDESGGTSEGSQPALVTRVTTVYQGTFRQCSSHKDCQPDECCIYGLSRGDSCVKHNKPCPVTEIPKRPRPRFCPPYNSGGYFYNKCSEPEDCPYPYLCCRLRGSYLCVPSFYDRRRRRRRQAAVDHYGHLHGTDKWLGLG